MLKIKSQKILKDILNLKINGDKMKLTSLEDYDKELIDMEESLAEMEEYIKEHPERLGYAGNYETYKYVYNIFKNDKLEFIAQLTEINLKLTRNPFNEGMHVINFTTLSNNFNETEKLTTNLLNSNFTEELLINRISEGSFKITFSFPNPTEDDVKRISPRKKGLLKIFDFINCADDIEKLKKEAGPDGREALMAYRNFLAEIVKNNADFTLDTEMGTLKAGLTLQQCKNICKNLNI